MSSADRRGLALIHTRQGSFFRSSVLEGAKERLRAPTTRSDVSWLGAALRQPDAQADSESRERLHLDATDATDESDGCPHRERKGKRKHNTQKLEHPPRARRRPLEVLERLRRRRPRRSI